MKFSVRTLASLLLVSSGIANAASWTFTDATISIQGKGSGVGGAAQKEKLDASKPLAKELSLGATDNLKIILTASEDKTAKRPHQAFLTLTDPSTGLEDSFPFSVKESGKAKVELSHKDIPLQLLTSSSPLQATITLASFGTSTPHRSQPFTLKIALDPSVPLPTTPSAIRYAAQPTITHTFRADPRSPPKIITLVFTAAVLACLPILLGAWVVLGANGNHIGRAMGRAPVAHVLFFGSVVALEGIFGMYYLSWNLFQTLPAALGVGVVAFLSGSRALSEVQERRLDGLR